MVGAEWIKALKPGDEVSYKGGLYANRTEITTVKRITPTGRVVTVDGKTFKPDGCCKVDSWTRYWLSPVTDEIRAILRKRECLKIIKQAAFEKYSVERLERIVAVINREAEVDKP